MRVPRRSVSRPCSGGMYSPPSRWVTSGTYTMVGHSVGHYRIVAELGAGGMGVVYRAIDERLQRPVAIQALPASLTGDEERRRRFVQEACAASALNAPHIITIHEICSELGADSVVMELVQGRTLREVAGGRPSHASRLSRATRAVRIHTAPLAHEVGDPPREGCGRPGVPPILVQRARRDAARRLASSRWRPPVADNYGSTW